MQYKKSEEGTETNAELLKLITDTMLHRKHLDSSLDIIGLILLGPANGPAVLKAKRGRGSPLVDDWDCLKSVVGFLSMFVLDLDIFSPVNLLCFDESLGSAF